MTSLIDQLAELTGHRDRNRADALLLDTLRELLEPVSAALHRRVGEACDQRWLTAVCHSGIGGRRVSTVARRPGFGQLPTLDSHPDRLECLRHQCTVELPGPPVVTLVPLLVGAQAVGVVELHTVVPLDEYRRHTAEALVRLYGNFLALLDYGERDALTGLYNRKTFNDCFMRAVLQRAPVACGDAGTDVFQPDPHWFLATLDLDHFKRVNDECGHIVGDEVLMLTARIMRSALGLDDGVFRFGGEEFVVLLEGSDEQEVHAQLENLRLRIRQYHFPQAGQVTASIGFTAVRGADLPTTAIERADRALYQAKTGGRDRVVGPSAMSEAGLTDDCSRGGDVDLF